MPLNKEDIKLVKIVAAAMKATNSDLTSVEVLDILFKDLQSGQRSLPTAFNYLAPFKKNIHADIFGMLTGDESYAEKSLAPLVKAFKDLRGFWFTEEHAVNWLITTKLNYTKAISTMGYAMSKMSIQMEERREQVEVAHEAIMNSNSEFYMEDMTSQIWNELFTPELEFNLKVSARYYSLEDEFESAFEAGNVQFNSTLLYEIARKQVLSQDYSVDSYPLLKKLTDTRNAPPISDHVPNHVLLPWNETSNFNISTISLSMGRSIDNNPTLTQGLVGVAVLLALAGLVGCVIYKGPLGCVRYTAGKIFTLFGNKDETYVPAPAAADAETEENKRSGCLSRYFYSRSTAN